MNNAYQTLDQLLAALRISISQLSLRTGITVARLRGIYKFCDPSRQELEGLLQALATPLVDAIASGGQTGSFNQAGIGNSQHVTINVLIQTAPAPQPRTRPRKPKALGAMPQQWEASRLLPSAQVGRSLTGSHGF